LSNHSEIKERYLGKDKKATSRNRTTYLWGLYDRKSASASQSGNWFYHQRASRKCTRNDEKLSSAVGSYSIRCRNQREICRCHASRAAKCHYISRSRRYEDWQSMVWFHCRPR